MKTQEYGSENPTENVDQSTGKAAQPTANYYQALLLGLAMKFGGCSVAWNYGLATGFWEYFIAVMLVGIGYLMLGLCMAEMVSIMTFDGGYYGYARVILGPLGGYLVGCSGLMESIFYFAAYPLKIAEFLEVCFNLNTAYDPSLWLGIYVGLLLLIILCSKYFWQITSIYTLSISVLFAIYLFGSMPSMDFNRYALINTKTGFNNDPSLFLDIFRLSVVFFIGFDLLTLTTSEIKEAKRAIPYAMLSLILTMVLLALWLMFTVASQPPGVTPELYEVSTYFPFVFGYMKIFNIDFKSATAISAFPTIGTSIAYLYIIARQVKAMASSGLLPSFVGYTLKLEQQEIPLGAYVTVCVAGYAANYFAWWVNVYTACTRTATTAGCFVYLSMFFCYAVFQHRYGHMERVFNNPLGIYSAIIGSLIFGAILVIMLAFHLEFRAITILYFCYMSVMLLYYYCYAETRQFFSQSEQKVFFKAYIINFQLRKKKTAYQRFTADANQILSWFYFPSTYRAAPIHPSQATSSKVAPKISHNSVSGSHNSSDRSTLYHKITHAAEDTKSNNQGVTKSSGSPCIEEMAAEHEETVTHRLFGDENAQMKE